MARTRGTTNFSANFETKIREPLDSRQRVETLANLIDPATWQNSGLEFTFPGMLVAVWNNGVNNGVYRLTAADYTNSSNWDKLGASGDISALSTALSTEISNRTSADGSLSTSISINTSKETSLSTALSSEVVARGSFDSSLSTVVSGKLDYRTFGTAANNNTGDFVAYRTFGTAANNNTGDFVAYRTFGTAANNDTGDFVAYRTFGTAANNATGDFATAAQGIEADNAATYSSIGNRQYSYNYIIADSESVTDSLNKLDQNLGPCYGNVWVGKGFPGYIFTGMYCKVIAGRIFLNGYYSTASTNTGWCPVMTGYFLSNYSEDYFSAWWSDLSHTSQDRRHMRVIKSGNYGQLQIKDPNTYQWYFSIDYNLDLAYWQPTPGSCF